LEGQGRSGKSVKAPCLVIRREGFRDGADGDSPAASKIVPNLSRAQEKPQFASGKREAFLHIG
jgi:hypothetical protein